MLTRTRKARATRSLHRSFHRDRDPPAGGRVRLAAADHRLPARARAVPQAAQGAARRRPALRAQATAASRRGRDHRRAGRVVRPRHHRRDPAGHAARHRSGALHPHASHQARHRHPQCAAPRREDLRRRQPGRGAQVRAVPRPGRAAAARVVPLARARCATCRESSAAIPEDLLELARLARKLGDPGARPVVPRGFAGARMPSNTSRPSRSARSSWRRRAARNSASSTRSTSAAAIPSSTARRSPTSAASARRSAPRSPNYRRACASSPSPAATSAGRPPSASRRSWAARRREGHWWYYLDDGLYGSYSGQLFDHAKYPVESLKEERGEISVGARRARPATASTSSRRT